MRSLIIVDDSSIRKSAFSEAAKILKKLDRLEQHIESFHAHDQKLFLNWMNLTFRDSRQATDKKHDEYNQLCRFHNWIITLSRMREISLGAALLILRQEEELFKTGTDQDRKHIEAARLERDRYCKQESKSDFEFTMNESNEDEDEDSDEPWSSKPPRTADEEDQFQDLRQCSDKELERMCRVRHEAFFNLAEALSLARSAVDHAVFLRIWDHTPRKHQQQFSKEYERYSGHSLEEMIAEMRRQIDEPEQDEPDSSTQHNFNSEPMSSGATSRAKTGAELELVKLIYRKLVRRLHPDLQEGGQSHWQKKIWDRVQTAHRSKNQLELEKLWRLVLIRTRELNEVTVSEILQSHDWLNDELERMAQDAKQLKRLPAWGFSRRTDYSPLKRKLEKTLFNERSAVQARIDELESQHQMLEWMGISEQKQRPRQARRKKNRRRTSRVDQLDLWDQF